MTRGSCLADFIYEPNMTLPASVILLILSRTSPHNVAKWDEKKKCYLFYSRSSVYYNGREDGFVLQVSDNPCGKVLNIYVTEHRSSDSICLETWESDTFGINPPANERPENSYETRMSFDYDKFYFVVDEIKDRIKKHLETQYKIRESKKKTAKVS